MSLLKAAQEAFTATTTLSLSNGIKIPQLQLGVYMSDGEECTNAVKWALEAGYRGIDSAEWYDNEAECGKAIKSFLSKNPHVKREEIFFTTKLKSNSNYDTTRKSIKSSLKRCGLDYIDLYLLHSPIGGAKAREDSWKAVLDAVKDGEVKSVGVSNFGVKHIQEFLQKFPNQLPAINQIELHPYNTQSAIVKICQENNILLQAYAPLARGMRFKHPAIKRLAEKYSVSPANVLVKWSLQEGYISLPKSVTKERIEQNLKGVEGWALEEEDMKTLEGLDEHLVTDWDPTNSA